MNVANGTPAAFAARSARRKSARRLKYTDRTRELCLFFFITRLTISSSLFNIFAPSFLTARLTYGYCRSLVKRDETATHEGMGVHVG